MSDTKNEGTPAKGSAAIKKWSGEAERDLCLAMFLSSNGEKSRADWAATHHTMTSLGYDFTRDAMK